MGRSSLLRGVFDIFKVRSGSAYNLVRSASLGLLTGCSWVLGVTTLSPSETITETDKPRTSAPVCSSVTKNVAADLLL